ncbi:isoprenylcysteine carboxylmethyltransferase family protein [Vibrio hannami]|uniref:methyltransferase family protein n=1 Tax=Vibrio hannami TaxID=2717094 RepID=UPI00240FD13B|nr:isoprenylcysteine carboxylmethyltransferase family protein [Vibrio hannami]MDG3088006.1 isoprenylcysteine carboxylmethyltransferase family protein [Vibrio hannami]
MDALKLKIPPVFVFLICIALIYFFDRMVVQLALELPARYAVFAICFVASGIFGLAGIYEFKKAKTSVHPVDIDKATTVVDSGIYRLSRNPMYFGLLLLLIGSAYMLQNVLSMLVCLLFVWYMNRFQIEPEEQHLTAKFGESYTRYKKRVRRWI